MEKPLWLKHTPQQVKEIIIKLAAQNVPEEKIGLVLRDTYGIPKVKLLGLKIGRTINQETGKKVNSTLFNMEKKVAHLKKHFEKNKQDKHSRQSLIKKASKLSKLKKHYEKA